MPIPRRAGGAGVKMDIFKATQVDPHTFHVWVDDGVDEKKFQNMLRRLRSCLAASDDIRELDEEAMEFDLYSEETESSRIVICLMDKNIRVEMED